MSMDAVVPAPVSVVVPPPTVPPRSAMPPQPTAFTPQPAVAAPAGAYTTEHIVQQVNIWGPKLGFKEGEHAEFQRSSAPHLPFHTDNFSGSWMNQLIVRVKALDKENHELTTKVDSLLNEAAGFEEVDEERDLIEQLKAFFKNPTKFVTEDEKATYFIEEEGYCNNTKNGDAVARIAKKVTRLRGVLETLPRDIA
jgi:hypothetical protein